MTSSHDMPLARVEPEPLPWIAEFLQKWWLACAVSLVLISIVVIAAISSSNPASPTVPKPAPPIAAEPPAPPAEPPAPATENPVVTAPPGRQEGAGPCKLAITTKPEGAHVRVDTKDVGVAPVTVAGPCARRRIEAVAPRWQTASKWVDVESESNVEVTLTRPKHALKVLSTPPGSTVSINGRRVGSTPTTAEVSGWTNLTIVIEKSGWKTSRQKHKSMKSKDEIYVKLVAKQ